MFVFQNQSKDRAELKILSNSYYSIVNSDNSITCCAYVPPCLVSVTLLPTAYLSINLHLMCQMAYQVSNLFFSFVLFSTILVKIFTKNPKSRNYLTIFLRSFIFHLILLVLLFLKPKFQTVEVLMNSYSHC